MTKFPKEIPYSTLSELVSMLRGQQPTGASLIADKVLWCAGCINAQFGLPDGGIVMMGAATPTALSDSHAADEIEKIVNASRVMAFESPESGATKEMPSWVSQLIQMLVQLWLSRKATA